MNLKSLNSVSLTEAIKAEAQNLGFFAYGIAKAEAVDDHTAKHIKDWIQKGNYADMDYMTNYTDKRLDPRLLMDGVKSIVCVALNYAPKKTIPKGEYQLAAYALGNDYHDIIKDKLRKLAAKFGFEDELHCNNSLANKCRIFVDSGPILERYWAEKAGLGWTGKNHQLIIPHAGSMFFLGELFLDVELKYDSPIKNNCGKCHKCIDACPADAISENNEIDAERCLSYQTIENRNNISNNVAIEMGETIYGCDKCLNACPWNKFAQPNDTPELQPKEELLNMTKEKWQNLTEEEYKVLFKGSAVKRAKYKGLKRNIDAVACINKEKKLTLYPKIQDYDKKSE